MAKKNNTKKPWQHKDVLEGMYHEQGLTMAQIGEIFGVSAVTIKYWMDKFEITSRDFDIGDLYRGKERDEEYRKHLSEVATERFKDKENHPMYGKKHSEETKLLMSKIAKQRRKEKKQKSEEQ